MRDFKNIESKWQKKWEESGIFEAKNDSKDPKKYILVEFPYPSGDGLHVGHCRGYTALDIIARKARMDGFNVLYPMGWDAFGLPTENYAIKTGKHPREVTRENTDNFKRQMKSLGYSFDWSREINTTDPEYYKWTQWIFLQFYKAGLAYKKKMPINWCVGCKIGLANEEVVNGACERCGGEVVKKEMEQWMLKITAYADKLINGLENVDFPKMVKDQQINWIGRSEGVEFELRIKNYELGIKVFTTRVDTVFGISAVVLAPEHELLKNKELKIKNRAEVEKYIDATNKKSELDRKDAEKEKTGVELEGIVAINPYNGKEVPVWIADYVLAGYGTGAVMSVPAHDVRDFVLAKKYGLDVIEVVKNGDGDLKEAMVEDGKLIESGEFSGLTSDDARGKMADFAKAKKFGERKINYHLRDWVFSRQHYWGEPIPLVFCPACKKQAENSKQIQNSKFSKGELSNLGWVPVAESNLPVTLPEVKSYEPTDTGESPLANIAEWVNVDCPKCGGSAKRETDTMPNWAGSSWYYLRYIDPKNNKVFADKKLLKDWLPVDIYNGGMEHTTLHLLYSRFWHKFLFDQGLVPTEEPYHRRTSHGMVLGHGGIKMSKSKGNVINPDDVVCEHGADVLRLYEMFMGPFSDAIPWDTKGLVGMQRFLDKVWKLSLKNQESGIKNQGLERLLHKAIKGVTLDIEGFKFNTAISKLMILTNEFSRVIARSVPTTRQSREVLEKLLLLLSPFAPHIAEELWSKLGNDDLLVKESWPKYDEALAKDDEIQLIVQVNGKVRDKITTSAGLSEEEAKKLALESENTIKHIDGKEIKKIIFTGKLVNIVV